VCWSRNSKDRRGYIQKEIKISLDQLQEKLIDDIYIIPVLLDDEVGIPDQMREIHCLKFSEQRFKADLIGSINHQIERLGGERREIEEQEKVVWQKRKLREEWSGLPGYRFDADLIEFTSDTYEDISQINQYLKGELLNLLFYEREAKIHQDHGLYNFAQDEWRRTNTTDIFIDKPAFRGKVVSLPFAISHYPGGAAHPTHGFMSYVFVLDPLIKIEKLSHVFDVPEIVFPRIQSAVRDKLIEFYRSINEVEGLSDFEADMVKTGTSQWDDLGHFAFEENGVAIFFSSYQVGPYAIGTPKIVIEYKEIADDMKEIFVTALEIWQFRS
jgi:uncharacterized protein (UPF0335 family)